MTNIAPHANAGDPPPPPPAPAQTPWQQRTARVQAWRVAHETQESASFFVLGFLLDVLTLDRIDSSFTMVQQLVYLSVLAVIMTVDQRYAVSAATPSPRVAQLLSFSESAVHFILGSLLSSFALFYFKSASGVSAGAFLVVMFGLLVANELPVFRRLGPVIRYGLLALCVTSFAAYVYPVMFGFLSAWLFLLSLLTAGAVMAVMGWLQWRFSGDRARTVREVAAPTAVVLVLLGAFHLGGVIPPVPLSVQYMGIYHDVRREGGAFLLKHERTWWRFWHHGDQLFRAREGDRMFCFARVFAPSHFRERVSLRWLQRDENKGWVTRDTVGLSVSGGRDEGFRTYAFKSRVTAGDWRAALETQDGREIGHIDVTVEQDAREEAPQWQVDTR